MSNLISAVAGDGRVNPFTSRHTHSMPLKQMSGLAISRQLVLTHQHTEFIMYKLVWTCGRIPPLAYEKA